MFRIPDETVKLEISVIPEIWEILCFDHDLPLGVLIFYA